MEKWAVCAKCQKSCIPFPMPLITRITKNYEFKKGVGIDSSIKSTETR